MSFNPLIRIVLLLFITITSVFFIVEQARADLGNQSTTTLITSGDWFYHWGDLSKDMGTGQWDFDKSDWWRTNSPEQIPGRGTEKIVWLKVTLPAGDWRDPYLFINSVDLTLQVFHKSQQIYQFGNIDAKGNSQFEGWPWHIIRLPDDYAQQSLYFRVFSNYPQIGFSGEVIVGEHFDLINIVYSQGLTGLFFIVTVLLVGIISTIMGTIKKDRVAAIATGLLSFNLALMMFAENALSQVVWYDPLFWRYVAAFSYFLIPAFLAIIIPAWLKSGRSFTSQCVLFITLGFSTIVALLSTFSEFSFINAYPWFDILFILLVLSLMFSFFKQVKHQRILGVLMAFGILTLFCSLVLDMMSAHGFINWIGRTGQFGLVLFTLTSLAIYLVQDWKQQISLEMLTERLESKVDERTAELQDSQEKLERMAHEDFLTLLLNRRSFSDQAIAEISNAIRFLRPISLLLFDIDHFKKVNDNYGHSAGDLVLKAIADSIRNSCREGDLICRYGGEEFVVLLHATDSSQAHILTKRLRQAISETAVTSDNKTIRITASFGLVCWKATNPTEENPEKLLDQLLAAADKAMYQVKMSGRDSIKVTNISGQPLADKELTSTA